MGELFELLDEPASGAAKSRHDAVAALVTRNLQACADGRRLTIFLGDRREWVAGLIFNGAGRLLSPDATWIRFCDVSRGTGLLAVLNGVSVDGEADLVMLASPGVIGRGVIRELCRWAFCNAMASRVVARVPAIRPELSDLLRRAGFLHEGIAWDFYQPGVDASVWAMPSGRCRWLGPVSSEPSVATLSPASTGVH